MYEVFVHIISRFHIICTVVELHHHIELLHKTALHSTHSNALMTSFIMRIVMLLACIALFVSASSSDLKIREKEAHNLIREYELKGKKLLNELMNAKWNYFTDLTTENHKILDKKTEEYETCILQYTDKARRICENDLPEVIRRQLKFKIYDHHHHYYY